MLCADRRYEISSVVPAIDYNVRSDYGGVRGGTWSNAPIDLALASTLLARLEQSASTKPPTPRSVAERRTIRQRAAPKGRPPHAADRAGSVNRVAEHHRQIQAGRSACDPKAWRSTMVADLRQAMPADAKNAASTSLGTRSRPTAMSSGGVLQHRCRSFQQRLGALDLSLALIAIYLIVADLGEDFADLGGERCR